MKFGEQLSSHLTPEWRKQYICYEGLKSLLYEIVAELPTDLDARSQYITQMDEKFFAECDRELTKINLFYSQKIAEAQGKFHELNAELTSLKEVLENRESQTFAGPTTLRQRFKRHSFSFQYIFKEHSKTAQQLKLAFSEFYLSLVLLQNYQQLNATGFRKILKKHDKLLENERGLDWRISKVEKSSFFLNHEVETLISNVERDVINDLEGGNRQAGMKRLKVPPLSEKQHATTTFTLGVFLGAFVVLGIAVIISGFAPSSRPREPKWVAVRLFRGPLLLFAAVWLCGLNMWGWSEAGVNHVLIFEVDPRNHLTYQSVMQIASFMCMLWSLSVLGYLYAHLIHLPPFLFPLLLMIICVVYLFNPFKKPDSIFRRNSRFWIIKHCFNCFSAPFHFVTFADFWLGDQMNSLITSFLDFQYFICFYTMEVDYAEWSITARTVNVTDNQPIPWGYVDVNTGRDMCTSFSGFRVLVSIFPATVRFMQCLRRFRDTGHAHPHLINAGKYFTTYLVVFFKSLNHWAEKNNPSVISVFFYFWVASYIVSFTYTFLWDVFMDWGLIDPLAPKDSPFLREEMIYGSKWYYYGAIVEDFILRLSWVLNVSLGEAWTLESDLLTCITAPLEVFRRFVWNYFRLENEHVNNCGQFRAVRDISVKPIKKGDLECLLSKIDDENGVSHRGQDLRIRVKRQKKAAKGRRQILRRPRFARIAIESEVYHLLSHFSFKASGHVVYVVHTCAMISKSVLIHVAKRVPHSVLVLQCAKAGHLSVGLELNLILILYSRWKAREECLSNMAKFYRKDIFKADLKHYKTAIIFGTENLMDDLSRKVKEMKMGSYLIACRFPLPPHANTQWLLLSTIDSGFSAVWLYEKICP
ncbi:unnamed protein product [Thelazia callipaeda]|uniref:Xenotropic and polytropic retrovirus receptor 1 n=1 Tax=Thelazia callipaeda TaxID=103827 RepID=A0A0N5DAC8_THECL|nr:unnamed protein product [Thelazia callipaeda]